MSLLSDKDISKKIRKFAHPYSRKLFLGVFSRDELPAMIPHYPCSLIINTDTKNLPGKHWVAIYISSFREGEYFDSFGQQPSEYVGKWLNQFTLYWKVVNKYPLQNALSLYCGSYALYFINERPQRRNVRDVKQVFTLDVFRNDDFVKRYFNSNFVKQK